MIITGSDGPTGTIMVEGVHEVWVDNKPASVYVSHHVLESAYSKMRNRLADGENIYFGVDHIPDSVFDEYSTLKKLKLQKVGKIEDLNLDPNGIHITQSTLTNPQFQELHKNKQLNDYSIVAMAATEPCNTPKADYKITDLTIERVDFVEKGACSKCSVQAKNTKKLNLKGVTLKMTHKKHTKKPNKHHDENVQSETHEPSVENVKHETNVTQVEDIKPETEEPKTETHEPSVENAKPESQSTEALESPKPSEQTIQNLNKEINKLKEEIDKLKNTKEQPDITKLIEAGKATPAMKTVLEKLYKKDSNLFTELTKQLQPILHTHRFTASNSNTNNSDYFKSDEYKEQLKQLGLKTQ